MQQPATTGGGAPSKDGSTGGGDVVAVAPEPIAPATAPEAGAQPAPPATAVTGGGEAVQGGGATCYQPAPDPVQCGQWVPAPVAPANGPDSPPEPIAGPTAGTTGSDIDGANGPAAPATTPASTLPTWAEWQQHFTRLGVSASEIGKIGAANLTDQQLAQVYTSIHESIVESGGVPGQTPLPAGAAWGPEWEQKFAALGLPPEFVAEIKAEALRTGADAGRLEAVYQQLVAKGGVPGTSAWSPAWEQKFAALGLPAEFVAQLKAQAMKEGAGDRQLEGVYQQLVQQVGGTPGASGPQQQAADGPGWNPQVEQAFRSLGMPDEVIKLYAESGAPLSGLEAAYKHAAGRVDDFTKRGWMEKFTAAGVPALDTWSAILGDQPIKDEDAQKLIDAHRKSQMSIWQKGGQLATSLFPGGRLLQYAFGKEFVSGEKIDRTDWKEIGFAALSGLAAFAAIRGARTIGAGWAARSGNYAQLNGVNSTLTGLKLPPGGVSSVQDAALGATQTWGAKQKLLSLIPGTALHKEIVGLGHAEAAARAFNNGGAARILANDADGALQLATITRMFDDIKSGATRVHGGALAYLGPFKKGPIMSLDTLKGGQEIIKVAKNLKIGNGNSQLVGLMEVGGTKLGRTPEWLTNAVNLTDDIASLSGQQRQTLGAVMAGNLARDLGGFTKDGLRPMKYIQGLANFGRGSTAVQPEWYTALANSTQAQWQTPARFEVLANHRLFTGLFDEAGAALAAFDRSALTPEASKLLDDAVAQMDDARGAWNSATKTNAVNEAVATSHLKFDEAVARLFEAEPQVAKTVFANYVDEGAFAIAREAAEGSLRTEWQAAAAAGGIVDDVAEAAVAGVDDIAEATSHALPAAGAAVTDDVVEGAAIASTPAAAPVAPAAAAPSAASAAPASATTATTTGGGSTVGSHWTPGSQPRKFTGSVSDYIADAQRSSSTPVVSRPATVPAAPASTTSGTTSAPVVLTTNPRGEAVTGSGLIVPSYASPVTPFAGSGVTSIDDPSIARLAEAMQRMRG